MIIKDAMLETVCGITSRLPENIYPEIAFCGKSNVGKSSLINALLNRKSLARTSSSPGKTQTINFYKAVCLIKMSTDTQGNTALCDEKKTSYKDGRITSPETSADLKKRDMSLYFVDLPGYGYADVSVEAKKQWGRMIENYLNLSRNLKCIFLLVDIRHKPSENDKLMYEWILKRGFEPVIIATKLDKIKRSVLERHIRIIKQELNTNSDIIAFSATDKRGRQEIFGIIDRLLYTG